MAWMAIRVKVKVVSGNLLYVNSIIGKAIIKGAVSKTQVRRVSCSPIPDQAQKIKTIVNNVMR
jgi:hypothetical protein